jgi:hypothetical protein
MNWNVEGSSRHTIRHLPGGTEERHEKLRIAGRRVEISTATFRNAKQEC